MDATPGTKKKDLSQAPKHTSVIIFVVIALFFIGYMVYMFVAYTENWFPFGNYVITPPPGAAQPTGQATPLTAQEQANASALVDQAFQNNCDYYCSSQVRGQNAKYPNLPTSQKIIGDCVCP